MPMMSFSEPEHMPLILNGTKRQTTRRPRKHTIKPGDILYCFYKLREKRACGTCISTQKCLFPLETRQNKNVKNNFPCIGYTHKFGEATVTSIQQLDFFSMTDEEADDWAIRDGFKDFEAADMWFQERYGDDWMFGEWVEIQFDPGWVKVMDECGY